MEALNSSIWSGTVQDGLQHVVGNWSIRWLFAEHEEEVVWPKDCYDTTSLTEAKAGYFLGSNARCRRGSRLPSFTVNVDRPRSHECFVVHFYSGLRRRGDIQYWIEQASLPPGILVTPLSVDIIFHEKLGDLSLDSTQERWIRFVADNDVIAIYVGPPCPTWSTSRWRYLTEDDAGPRPVRSVTLPFGVDACRIELVNCGTYFWETSSFSSPSRFWPPGSKRTHRIARTSISSGY